ncbi:MAG: hypothetical protein ACK58J_15245, partial [Planctomyces sp.]
MGLLLSVLRCSMLHVESAQGHPANRKSLQNPEPPLAEQPARSVPHDTWAGTAIPDRYRSVHRQG